MRLAQPGVCARSASISMRQHPVRARHPYLGRLGGPVGSADSAGPAGSAAINSPAAYRLNPWTDSAGTGYQVAIMKDELGNVGRPAVDGTDSPPVPAVVDRATWQAQLDDLLVREKAHTREGDAIAAARRRLPMVEVDAAIPLTGENGPVPLLEVFEGRRQLIVYFHMWHTGQPAPAQCEGCTFFNGQIRELSYLHSRDVTYATFCQGPYEESIAYRDFMGWDMPWYSAQDSAGALLAGRWFGMQVCYLRQGDRVFETYWSSGRTA